MATDVSREQLLSELYSKIKKCSKCSELVAYRKQAVPGVGNPKAEIMFVGEAPGADEDRQGFPFVGKAGQLLNRLLEKIGLHRDDVYIANILKCRPPENREPQPVEIDNCREYLHAQITLIRPRLICTLGNPALKTLIDPSLTIGKVHGQVLRKNGLVFFPIYHPAAALHQGKTLNELVGDFEALQKYIRTEIS